MYVYACTHKPHYVLQTIMEKGKGVCLFVVSPGLWSIGQYHVSNNKDKILPVENCFIFSQKFVLRLFILYIVAVDNFPDSLVCAYLFCVLGSLCQSDTLA